MVFTAFWIGGNSSPCRRGLGTGFALGYFISPATGCCFSAVTICERASRVSPRSRLESCSDSVLTTFCKNSVANTEWAARDDSPSTRAIASSSGGTQWLDGVDVDDGSGANRVMGSIWGVAILLATLPWLVPDDGFTFISWSRRITVSRRRSI